MVDNLYIKNIKIRGHTLKKTPKCYLGGKWMECLHEIFSSSLGSTKGKADIKDYKYNDIIIGYIYKTRNGKMVFKLKYTKREDDDKRKIYKGFVCNQHNNKNELLNISSLLKIKGLSNKNTIDDICTKIELRLRKNENDERLKKSNVKWFFEYVEILRLGDINKMQDI